MKTTKLILTSLAATAALLSNSFAQSTVAVTDPVGYITVSVNGQASGAQTTNVISPTLVNKTEFQGPVTSAAGTTLTVSGLTAATFNENHWVEVVTGTGEGAWTNIVSNTATTIVTADDISSLVAGGATVKIRKHVTIGEFLGSTNTAGLLPGGDAGLADEVVFYDNSGPAPVLTSVFYDPAGGWTDDAFDSATNKVIEPGQGLLVLRKGNSSINFTYVGHVKTGKTQVAVHKGTNVLPQTRATGGTIGDSNLFTGSTTSGVLVGGDAGVADELVVLSTTGTPTSNFHDGTQWFDDGFSPSATTPLKEGAGVLLLRKATASFSWTNPAQVIQN